MHKNSYFDALWYLYQYPDVAASGMDPWVHYLQHGRAEGRLPRQNRALAWDHHLWRGAQDVMLPRLARLLGDDGATDEEQLYARWALARWFAWQQQWTAVIELLLPDGRLLAFSDVGPGLLAVQAHVQLLASKSVSAVDLKRLLAQLRVQFVSCPNVSLAQMNVLSLQPVNDAKRLNLLNGIFKRAGLSEVKARVSRARLSLDNVAAVQAKALGRGGAFSNAPLVSVIVPMYSAQATIGTALRGLFEQTWRPIEIVVVDDGSQDDSVAVVQGLTKRAPSGVTLKLITQVKNRGAYAARNSGLKAASGEFVTTHDSDDWSHPQKIAMQVQALIAQNTAVGCLSHWVRASQTLVFGHWFNVPEGWIYRNMSSLMFRRAVFDRLGYWDEVKVNGDTEFHERVLTVFGLQAVVDVMPEVPLSFGRMDVGSLSQRSETNLITLFVGVRCDYMASARRWHQNAAGAVSGLKLSRSPKTRPFVAPAAIALKKLAVQFVHPLDEMQASGLFDAGWYMRTHIDLQQHVVDPLQHYWEVGAKEGRDPGPRFSTTGYLRRVPKVAKSGVNPLLHYVRSGVIDDAVARPVFKGRVPLRRNCPTVLLVGHAAGQTLYGAERSLLDVALAIRGFGLNLVVTLPSAVNDEYLDALLAVSSAVGVAPYGWWQDGKREQAQTVDWFVELIDRFDVDLMHVNTLVLDEPIGAAKARQIPVVVHVRELPEHDRSLCETLNAAPEVLRERALACADGVIANSQCVMGWLMGDSVGMTQGSGLNVTDDNAVDVAKSKNIFYVPNTVDFEVLLALPTRQARANRLIVGMLSSNFPKKGLEDLESVALCLGELDPKIRFVLYGPRSAAFDQLLRRVEQGLVPDTIQYGGYVDSPAEALVELDVVINLSQFQESFGRTILEAMAAGRPAVVYDWGALPELVDDGRTGFVVPFRDTEAVAQALMRLRGSVTLRKSMGRRGRERALDSFSDQALADRLACVYERFGLMS